ncbi:MAG: hypothetical protein ACBR23_21855 [Microcoleus sp.]|uniref:Uncharacterized protein n=1 Tax=Microcoleus anatoxicus PTRS2 TaxID=2705321 RepID=A0ABU8YJE1_9CYAN
MPNAQFPIFPDLMYDRYQFCKGRINNVPKSNNKLDSPSRDQELAPNLELVRFSGN